MTLNFYLRSEPKKAAADGKMPVRLKVSLNNEVIWIPTELRVHPDNWIPKGGINKAGEFSKAETNYRQKNDILKMLITQVEAAELALHRELQPQKRKVTADLLRKALEPPAEPTAKRHEISQIFEDWLADNPELADKTKERYVPVVDHMHEFGGDYITPHIWDKAWMGRYFSWLRLNTRTKSDNSLSSHIKFMRMALQRLNLPFTWCKDTFRFKTLVITLTFQERQKLFDCDPPTQAMKDFRDTYLLACCLGPRFGDLMRLDESNVKKRRIMIDNLVKQVKVLEYTQEKTGNLARMEISEMAEKIIDRNKGRWPGLVNRYKSQPYNRYAKTLGKLAGITEPTKQITYINKKLIETVKPKWEHMTSHTARRTCATLLLEGGADITVICDAMGWSDFNTAQRYADNSDKHLHQEIYKAWTELHRINQPIAQAS